MKLAIKIILFIAILFGINLFLSSLEIAESQEAISQMYVHGSSAIVSLYSKLKGIDWILYLISFVIIFMEEIIGLVKIIME